MANCEVQTSYEGLKVSEINKESFTDKENIRTNFFVLEIFSFLCMSPSGPDSTRQDAQKQVSISVLVFLGLSDPHDIQVNCQ